MIVLGIDPGTAATGYGIVERTGSKLRAVDYGCLETLPTQELPQRLLEIHQAILELIETHKPSLLGVERIFFNKNVRTALSVGQARGVAILAAAHAGCVIAEYTPLQVKQAVVGYGRAEKEQVQRMVQILLHMDHIPQPDDAADALAVAICHIHSRAYEARISEG